MKVTAKFVFLFILIAALAWPGTALAKGLREDKVVFGGSYTLASGETLDGNLVVLGGIAILEEGSQVDGDVLLAGGTLDISGEITGNVVALGGLADLKASTVIRGDVTMIGAHLQREAGAVVEGKVITNFNGPLSLDFPGGVRMPQFEASFTPFFDLLWFMFRVFMWAALAVLVALFLPVQTKRTADAAVKQPLVAGGLGLLTVVITPPALIILAITILLIPASLLAALLVAIAWMFGLISLGFEVGNRLAEMLKQEWAPPVSAGAGTFVLILVINGVDALIPCVGWLVPAIAGMVGLGAVILTRFGTQAYPLYPPLAPLSPGGGRPPAPPVGPLPAEVEEAPASEEPVESPAPQEEAQPEETQPDEAPPAS
jgi:hypothetical protein